MKKLSLFAAPILVLLLCLAQCAPADVLVLNDTLMNSTSGTRNGGVLQSDGWRVTGLGDYIYWHLGHTVHRGRVEFDIKGVYPDESRYRLDDKTEIFHMYDYTYGGFDSGRQEWRPDFDYGYYRDNPYKHFIRKIGHSGGRIDAFELVFKIHDNYEEPDTSALQWAFSTTYHMKETWEPDGEGRCVLRTYRDDVLLRTVTVPGSWDPKGHSIKIGNIHYNYGAPVDAVYSNMVVYDTATAAPATPGVTWPKSGMTVNSRTPGIRLTGNDHSKYQVRVCTSNSPSSGIVWDSGEVTSNQYHLTSGTLPNLTNCYVFARLGNVVGWSPWSATGHWFRVDTSYTQANPGIVTISGNSFADNNGPFLGLGVTYMSAMRKCKYYRDRFENDLAFLSSRGFNYVRILTMVGWYSAWDGKSICPVTFVGQSGYPNDKWGDYWQQFQDTIDLIYSYGMRAEITIFADAQLMPGDTERYAHMDSILSNLAGRQHKVAFLEIGNEFYQNGLDLTQLRAYGAYLAARTSIPVALSSSGGGWDLEDIYSGSGADLATEHFSRDIGTFEGGWRPVRDPWYVDDLPYLPACTSNEPVGPGSSVSSENDPIKLVSAACYAWIARLPGYVYHTSAGVFGDWRFQDMAGSSDFAQLRNILPPDLSNWARNGESASDAASPFTPYCNGVAQKYWTDFGTQSLPDGCHRNIGGIKGRQFVCYPQGILSGGVRLKANRDMSFTAYNPRTGAIASVYNVSGVVIDTSDVRENDIVVLHQGDGAYIIKGTFAADAVPPASPEHLAVSPGDGQNVLTWHNPSDADFLGTKVLFRTDRYPTNQADGTTVCDKVGTAGGSEQFTHTGRTNGVCYYYAAFAYDDSGNYSQPVGAIGIPVAGQCFSERFNYPDGGVNGNRSWTGDAVSEVAILSGAVKVTGGADHREAIHPASCCGSGGIIDAYVNVKSGSGTTTLWGVWFDDANGNNLARWYGSGTTVRGRIAGSSYVLPCATCPAITLTGGWDTLRVRINTAANTTEFFFNGVSLGTLSHTISGAGDCIGRVKIDREYNSTGANVVYLDNLVIGPTALDITSPSPVTNFAVVDQGSQASLSWVNPVDADYAGTRILYSKDGYPTGPWDGTILYDGTGTNCVHASLPSGTIYYAAYAYDRAMNFSTAVTAIIDRPVCFSDSFSYPNGSLNGNGGWTGTATTQIVVDSQSVKILGGPTAYDSIRNVSCDGAGGLASVKLKAKRGSGSNTLWNLYIDDPQGRNLAHWYGLGTSARGRIGIGSQVSTSKSLTSTSVWDDLYVKINFVTNRSEFFFNGVSIGELDHSETSAGDSIGRLKFERESYANGAGQYVYLDELIVGSADATAPTPVASAPSVPITKVGPVSYSVDFGETVYGFDSASDVQLNATGSATATVAVTGSGPYTVTLSNITGSGTLGITVNASSCIDVAGNANVASAASATVKVITVDGRISDVKDDANGSPVVLGGKALFLKQSTFGYIEEMDRTAGIRVEGALGGSVGDLVCLSGVMATTPGGERYVNVDAMAACGVGSVDPFGLNNRALIDDFVCGLRVKAWGKVKPGSITANSYVLTDGSDDAGIKVITSGAPGVSENQFVTIVGAAGLDGVRVIYAN